MKERAPAPGLDATCSVIAPPLTHVLEMSSETLQHTCADASKVSAGGRRPVSGLVLKPGRTRPESGPEPKESETSRKALAYVSSPFKTKAARLPAPVRTDRSTGDPRDSSGHGVHVRGRPARHRQMFTYYNWHRSFRDDSVRAEFQQSSSGNS